MPKEKKAQKALNLRMDASLWDELDTYCEESGRSKTYVTEKAIEHFLETEKKNEEKLKS